MTITWLHRLSRIHKCKETVVRVFQTGMENESVNKDYFIDSQCNRLPNEVGCSDNSLSKAVYVRLDIITPSYVTISLHKGAFCLISGLNGSVYVRYIMIAAEVHSLNDFLLIAEHQVPVLVHNSLSA